MKCILSHPSANLHVPFSIMGFSKAAYVVGSAHVHSHHRLDSRLERTESGVASCYSVAELSHPQEEHQRISGRELKLVIMGSPTQHI